MVPKGTVAQLVVGRPPPKPNRNTHTSTCKLPEATGKQPLKEGELNCYECGQKGHMQPQCLKLRSQRIAVVREDNSEGIAKNIKGNLKEDAKDDVSEEGEILLEEEKNLNKGSDQDEEMYLWDEFEYKASYIRFISNVYTEQQMQVVSAVIEKLEEPVYDHRARIKERSRPLQKCNDNQPISVFWEIGGVKAHCLIDSRYEGIMIPPSFIRAVKIEPFPLEKPIGSNG